MCCVILGILLFLIRGFAAEDASTTESSTTSISDDNVKYRPLTVGDTFTPSEMLPVATKLIQISGPLGEGKGIVSSAPSPQHLAERLYEAFFITNTHIAVIKPADIAGLNALQALALSGETFSAFNADVGIDLSSLKVYEQKHTDANVEPVSCIYKLLKKKVDSKRDMSVNRRALKIAQKLGKKRKLKVQPIPKPGGKHRRALKIAQKLGKKRKLKVQPIPKPGGKHRRALKIAKKLGKKRQLKVHPPPGPKHRRDSSNHNTDKQISHPATLYETASLKPESSTKNANKYIVTGSTSPGSLYDIINRKEKSSTQGGYSNQPVKLNASASVTPDLFTGTASASLIISSILPKSLKDIVIKKQNSTTRDGSNQPVDLSPSASVNPRQKAEFSPAPVTDVNENLKFKSGCHYTYECKHPVDMHSCRLYVSCDKKDAEDGFHIKHLEDEHEKSIKEVRKIFGINLVDEEVEKIIERRFLSQKPRKKHGEPLERVKHLEQFFARVESENKGGFTVPMKPSTEANYVKKD